MNKKAIFVCVAVGLFTTTILKAQAGLPDIDKLKSMTPAEQEKYKQELLKQASAKAKKLSQQYDIKIDETALPDFRIQLPVKDIKRLAMVPLKAPSRMELMTAVQQSRQQLEAATSPAVVQEVKKIVSEQNPAQLQSSSVACGIRISPSRHY